MLALFIGIELLRVLHRVLVPAVSLTHSVAPFSTPQEAPGTILANLLLVQSLHLYDFLTWNLPGWSISTEFYTYVVFAVCLVGLRRHAWIALLVAMIGGPVLIATLSERGMDTSYGWGIIRCIYGFAAGAISWNIHKKWNEKLGKWLRGSIVEWCALALVVVFVSTAGTTLLSTAAPYVFALVVLVFAFEAGTVSAVLKLRPLVFLGTVSYSIYMTHVFIARRIFDAGYQLEKRWHINPFTHRTIDGGDVPFLGIQPWHGDIAYVVYLAMIIGMSYFTYSWIEKPAREWVRKRVRGRRQQTVTSRGIVSA
jgi:peptidoglycan/LPS O-acetylase OafA/YrhL